MPKLTKAETIVKGYLSADNYRTIDELAASASAEGLTFAQMTTALDKLLQKGIVVTDKIDTKRGRPKAIGYSLEAE